MKIKILDTAEAGRLVKTYNDQIVGIPHCYNVSQEEFMDGFVYQKASFEFRSATTGKIDSYYNESIHSEKLIVCEENGEIVGFADVAVAETELDGKAEQKGFIRFLTYKIGHRPIGQAILAESESYLLSLGVKQIKAFRLLYLNDHCGYRFYHAGYGMVSDKLGHIFGLFGINGYKINGGEIFMDWSDYHIDEPSLPDKSLDITVDYKDGHADRSGAVVKAVRNGAEIGSCQSASVGESSRSEEAQDWIFITGLGVNENEQRKGLGRYLLQRNLWEMKQVGYKNTVISTDWHNFRAFLFYTNYGYKLVDTMYEFVKNFE